MLVSSSNDFCRYRYLQMSLLNTCFQQIKQMINLCDVKTNIIVSHNWKLRPCGKLTSRDKVRPLWPSNTMWQSKTMWQHVSVRWQSNIVLTNRQNTSMSNLKVVAPDFKTKILNLGVCDKGKSINIGTCIVHYYMQSTPWGNHCCLIPLVPICIVRWSCVCYIWKKIINRIMLTNSLFVDKDFRSDGSQLEICYELQNVLIKIKYSLGSTSLTILITALHCTALHCTALHCTANTGVHTCTYPLRVSGSSLASKIHTVVLHVALSPSCTMLPPGANQVQRQ